MCWLGASVAPSMAERPATVRVAAGRCSMALAHTARARSKKRACNQTGARFTAIILNAEQSWNSASRSENPEGPRRAPFNRRRFNHQYHWITDFINQKASRLHHLAARLPHGLTVEFPRLTCTMRRGICCVWIDSPARPVFRAARTVPAQAAVPLNGASTQRA